MAGSCAGSVVGGRADCCSARPPGGTGPGPRLWPASAAGNPPRRPQLGRRAGRKREVHPVYPNSMPQPRCQKSYHSSCGYVDLRRAAGEVGWIVPGHVKPAHPITHPITGRRVMCGFRRLAGEKPATVRAHLHICLSLAAVRVGLALARAQRLSQLLAMDHSVSVDEEK